MYLHRCFDRIPIPTGIPSSGTMYFSPKMKKHRHKMPQVICFEDDPINIALLGTVSLIVAQCFL